MSEADFREIYKGVDKETAKVGFRYFHRVGVDNWNAMLIRFSYTEI